MAVSKLTQKIRSANEQGRKALIPYLPGGFPDREQFWKEIEALDAAGADVIELGVPFSDPVADGPVVEQAALDCLECGITLHWILDELKKRRAGFTAEFVLMGYMNPFLQYGLEKLAEDAAKAGVAGFIIPDVPLEESSNLREVFDPKELDLIPLVGLNTSRERMQEYAADAKGFVYFVTVLGITGVRDSLPDEVVAKIAECKAVFDIPVAAGFGIKTPEQVQAFGESIDAVVFGSALIKHIRGGGSSSSFMQAWR